MSGAITRHDEHVGERWAAKLKEFYFDTLAVLALASFPSEGGTTSYAGVQKAL